MDIQPHNVSGRPARMQRRDLRVSVERGIRPRVAHFFAKSCSDRVMQMSASARPDSLCRWFIAYADTYARYSAREQYCRVHSLARAEGPTPMVAGPGSKQCGRILGGPIPRVASAPATLNRINTSAMITSLDISCGHLSWYLFKPHLLFGASSTA